MSARINASPRQLFLLLLVIAVTIAAGGAFLINRSLFQSLPGLEQATVIEVQPGSSLTRLGMELQRQGLLRSPRMLNLLARYRGVAGAIKPGEYELTPGMSAAQLLDKLVAGSNVQYRLTLVEGWTVARALEEIWRANKIKRQLQRYDPPGVASLLGLELDNPEGMLFPDTYFYTAGTTDIELLQRAGQRLQQMLDSAWQARLGALPYENSYEALILASIIEKESSQASERGEIAGVFVRRLEQGMRLQSDPTVIYGMGLAFDGNLTRADLQAETPYNTYRIFGLPPTPIALAGLDSIRASLNPVESDALYFVATGDGGHYFSATLEEHNAAVERYQLQPTSQDSLE